MKNSQNQKYCLCDINRIRTNFLNRLEIKQAWMIIMACAALLFLQAQIANAQDQPLPETGNSVTASFQEQLDTNSPYIIGGSDAEPGEWPWQVALVYGYYGNAFEGQFCGGSLIASDWVLTAAHTVSGPSPSEIDAVIGRTDLRADAGERIAVAEIMVHSKYSPGSSYDPDLNHDVALLRLAEPSTQTPIALYNPKDEPNELRFLNATVTGWGYTSYSSYYGTLNPILQELTLPLVSHETCNSNEAYAGIVSENMLCAGYQKGVKGACYGDSGGPLMVYDEDDAQWLQVGIVSWGEGCAEANKYDVYTRVAQCSPWALGCVENVHSSACTGGDSYEPDNAVEEATLLTLNEPQEHNFHQLSDVDWFHFQAEVNRAYQIETMSVQKDTPAADTSSLDSEQIDADTYLWLYSQNGLSALAADDDSGIGKGSRILWVAPQAGRYYVAVNSVSNVSDDHEAYSITIRKMNVVFAPVLLQK
ncbi:serine protease [Chloroflexi bacterium TSY]|nr:serine protease [Chloroflexi bacterium TSY]